MAPTSGEQGLERYHGRRRFGATPEPRGSVSRDRRARRIFVIQKHHARALHYDFRLELDGTLKSWAVPKGPSLDPGVRRMAVEVEDHPLEYAEFEGTIPAGHYGAGTVEIWDRGSWEPDGEEDPQAALAAGRLKFRLDGERLHGRWMLVRTRGRAGRSPQWLLIKERDGEARTAPWLDRIALLEQARPGRLPERLQPQLATLVDHVPRGIAWGFEVKFDGYRILARIHAGEVRLLTRNGHDWTARLPSLRDALARCPVADAWLDGEIVMPGRNGMPDFQALQNAFSDGGTDDVLYYLFDLPWCESHDLGNVPLARRRALLRDIVAAIDDPMVRFSDDFETGGTALLDEACRIGLEGVIGKRRDSPYVQQRSGDWVKLKCIRRQEFVIGGYTEPSGSRIGFGALLLGYWRDGALQYAGRVGTGFTDASLRDIHRQLVRLARRTSPFQAPPPLRRAHWVTPKLVAEVSFSEWTRDGHLRRPVFHGLRSDKPARDIGIEVPAEAPATRRSYPLTHPDRIVDEQSGATKRDLARYYDVMADALLPHLKDRPLALVRAPEGVGGARFFQKHVSQEQIPGIRVLPAELDPGHAPPVTIDDRDTLIHAAQANVFELHGWNATADDIEHPDRLVFDLDPGQGIAWPTMRDAALLVAGFLRELELVPLLKTSGSQGVHVVVPILRECGWDEAKAFSKAVVEHLARVLPALFVAKSGPRNRVGRIFVDYLRNGRGATTVAAFSPRLRPGLPVSVPVHEDELKTLDSPRGWTIFDTRALLARLRDDPWRDGEASRRSIASGRAMLERVRKEEGSR